MHRIWAIIERDLRRFRRSPTLIVVTMVMPLLQLVVLGYAFGGKIKHLEIGVVDQDHGVPVVRLKEMFQAVAANARTFDTIAYSDQGEALRDLREGRIGGLVTIPPDFSRQLLAGASPRIALIEDNTDQFSAASLEGALTQLLASYNQKSPSPRLTANVTLSVVEVYPYVPYIQYLLPGTIVLAIFVSAMIGGGIIFIAAKAVLAGLVMVTFGSLIAGIPDPLNPVRLLQMFVLVVVTALALISMMFLLVVRVSDPLVPRALFGVLNTMLFFPSGAVYPINAFPAWMKVIAKVDPFTYAVHGFKELLLKNTGLGAIGFDLFYLGAFTVIVMAAATALFRRTL